MNFFKTHPKLWKRSLAVLVVLAVAGGIWALYSPWFRLKLAHGLGCTQIAEITFKEGVPPALISHSGEDLYVDFLQKDQRGMPDLSLGFFVEERGWNLGMASYLLPKEGKESAKAVDTELAVLVRWVDTPGTEQTFPVEEPVDIQVRYYSVGDRTVEAVLFFGEEEDWMDSEVDKYFDIQWNIDKAYELLGEAS